MAPTFKNKLQMRESWERSIPWLNLNIDSLTELIQPIFKGRHVISAQPTQGRFLNRDLSSTVISSAEQVLINTMTYRIYCRLGSAKPPPNLQYIRYIRCIRC
ncbi:hypothetical protein NIES2101_37560 [Calothrix sp. HK-06]|nr:hypothetical protein NIES2101_37560 [Calothrix sp. HK-06]